MLAARVCMVVCILIAIRLHCGCSLRVERPAPAAYACLGPYWDHADAKLLEACRAYAKELHLETRKD